MNKVEQSERSKAGFWKGFQDGSSRLAQRWCYGYDRDAEGNLIINIEEAKIVRWIFEQYRDGKSLGKIADSLEERGFASPTGKEKWNGEAIDKLLSNEKYTGRVLLQKTLNGGSFRKENIGCEDRYLYSGAHEAIISDELFRFTRSSHNRRGLISLPISKSERFSVPFTATGINTGSHTRQGDRIH